MAVMRGLQHPEQAREHLAEFHDGEFASKWELVWGARGAAVFHHVSSPDLHQLAIKMLN